MWSTLKTQTLAKVEELQRYKDDLWKSYDDVAISTVDTPNICPSNFEAGGQLARQDIKMAQQLYGKGREMGEEIDQQEIKLSEKIEELIQEITRKLQEDKEQLKNFQEQDLLMHMKEKFSEQEKKIDEKLEELVRKTQQVVECQTERLKIIEGYEKQIDLTLEEQGKYLEDKFEEQAHIMEDTFLEQERKLKRMKDNLKREITLNIIKMNKS